MPRAPRLTQQHIARLAGVSQATVSLVLNGADPALARIPAETRERIQKIIRDTGYVPDPIARRMAQGANRILGVFTYEPAFPSAQADFFLPFLFGIEEEAQARGYDLLLLTGSRGANQAGGRKIFAEGNRLRLADGCLVLGRHFDHDELTRLVAGDFPFMAIGRREDAGAPVPYVGADYASATSALVQQARELGHRKLAYLGALGPAESPADRWRGFQAALGADLELVLQQQDTRAPDGELLDAVRARGATAVFCVELADALRLEAAARARGLALPDDLSLVALGSHERVEAHATRFASFLIPREQMGRDATAALVLRIERGAGQPVHQSLLPCDPIRGETLGPAPR
ncbi:LacI family DNA-binding transcriptional regulator [Variovorax sp.]|uniref:LacI family DNA-binding transcriptional regulator n=1 Tax=Variovorax sp. TaxID=1871043 RepID=UPI002D71D3A7|nr:LacI family DNA-binding transcriptional regulator [Variovorax sp.]HYP83481.1 LacI family DNA-binding transcriptional regulator [Variovorax sp.]